MVFEVIKNIVETEKEADSIKAKADGDAKAVIAEAVSQREQLVQNIKGEAKAEEERMISRTLEEAKGEVSKIIAGAEDACRQLKTNAQAKKSDAVNAVIRKVVKSNGDS